MSLYSSRKALIDDVHPPAGRQLTDTAYDGFMRPLEWMDLGNWRSDLLRLVEPPVLEVGVGTGASLASYDGMKPVAIDPNIRLMRKARRRAVAHHSQVTLIQMDVLRLAFPDSTFASAVTSLVFCSVTDPLHGLRQLRRVLRPGAKLCMLEHVRPKHPLLGPLVDWFNIPWHAINGTCRLNRRTADNVVAAGFTMVSVETRLAGAINLIVARA